MNNIEEENPGYIHITLGDFIPVKNKEKNISYFDLLCDDVLLYLEKNFLDNRDLLCLQLSKMEEGRNLTEKEIRQIKECEIQDNMEKKFYENIMNLFRYLPGYDEDDEDYLEV